MLTCELMVKKVTPEKTPYKARESTNSECSKSNEKTCSHSGMDYALTIVSNDRIIIWSVEFAKDSANRGIQLNKIKFH